MVIAFINRHSGKSNDQEKELVGYLRESFGDDLDLYFFESGDLKAKIEEKLRNDTKKLLIAGGDGTINAGVNALKNRDIALGVIPYGTFNDFARVLKMPQDLKKAVDCIKDGDTKIIDVAEVNDIRYVNNSSLGIYPQTLASRDRIVRDFGLGKMLSMVISFFRTFQRFPMYYIHLIAEKEKYSFKTPFVFVGNNIYDFKVENVGDRRKLDEGKLCLVFTSCSYRFCLIKNAFLKLSGKLKNEKYLTEKHLEEVIIDSKKKKLKVSTDGEILELKPPLRYKVLPKNLQVIVPRK